MLIFPSFQLLDFVLYYPSWARCVLWYRQDVFFPLFLNNKCSFYLRILCSCDLSLIYLFIFTINLFFRNSYTGHFVR